MTFFSVRSEFERSEANEDESVALLLRLLYHNCTFDSHLFDPTKANKKEQVETLNSNFRID